MNDGLLSTPLRIEDAKRGDERRRGTLWRVGEDDLLFVEQFKTLRSKLEHMADRRGLKSVGITSTIAGEGKTLICSKIALNLARTKRRSVLLVDADIRKADLTTGQGNPLSPGLTEYLLGCASLKDIVRGSPIAGLNTVSTGAPTATSGDLLAGDKFRAFLVEATGSYDIVLLDTPPVLAVADTMSMRERVDGFLFVYRAGFTPFAMFQQATEEIGEAKILGVILNAVEPKADRYYSHYYGRYYTGKTPAATVE